MRHGIDLSRWNDSSQIDWRGIDFVCVRVTLGLRVDERAVEHLRRARDHDVADLLAYHYETCGAPGDEQARVYLDRVTQIEQLLGLGALALAVDVEDPPAPGAPWPRKLYSETINMSFAHLRGETSRAIGIYGSGSYLAGLELSPLVHTSPLWLADWTPPADIPRPWTRLAIWQTGVKGGIDRDAFAGTAEDWRALWHPPLPYELLGGAVAGVRDAMGLGDGADAFRSRDEGPAIK